MIELLIREVIRQSRDTTPCEFISEPPAHKSVKKRTINVQAVVKDSQFQYIKEAILKGIYCQLKLDDSWSVYILMAGWWRPLGWTSSSEKEKKKVLSGFLEPYPADSKASWCWFAIFVLIGSIRSTEVPIVLLVNSYLLRTCAGLKDWGFSTFNDEEIRIG